jgi:hypothetical protein
MTSEMKVTLVANASQPVSEIAKLQAAANDSAKSFAQVTKAATEGAKAASGSFLDLKAKLGAARAELDRLAEGTPEFSQQAAVVKQLNAEFAQAKQKIAELTAAETALATGTATIQQQETAVKAMAGSFAALETNLKENVARLKEMEAGTPEFQQQAAIVRQLATEFDAAKQQISDVVTVEKQLATGTVVLEDQSQAAKAAVGSFTQLEAELKDNVTQLRNMQQGTAEFAAQKRKVDELRGSLEKAKAATADGIQTQSGIGGIVDDFTSSLSATVTTLVSVGAIAASLKQDLENIKRVNENKRLSEVEFGKAISARSISNLGEDERLAVRPLALNLADELGLNAGGIVEALGTLRSSGADNIVEASEFLKEAAKAFPQDLAQATAIAQGALIEARATGNRNAQEVIGGLTQSQAVSQVTDAVSFAKAFSANTAGAVAILKLSAEKAREEASIFSVLEPKSADVAATSQQAFFRQLQNFVPEASVKLKTGGVAKTTADDRKEFMAASFEERMRLVETNANLQAQFIGGLQETGQNAIIRRIKPTQEDQASFDTIRQGIMGDADAAKALVKLQDEASTAGAFAIAEGQRKASEETANLRAEGSAKLEAELEQIFTNVQERTRSFVGGTAVSGAERFGARTEQLFTGAERGQVLLDTVKFRAANATDPEDKRYLEQQVRNLEALQRQIELQTASTERGNQLLEQIVANQKAGGNAQPPVKPPVARAPIAQGLAQ